MSRDKAKGLANYIKTSLSNNDVCHTWANKQLYLIATEFLALDRENRIIKKALQWYRDCGQVEVELDGGDVARAALISIDDIAVRLTHH